MLPAMYTSLALLPHTAFKRAVTGDVCGIHIPFPVE
jgi:hypothetical protein